MWPPGSRLKWRSRGWSFCFCAQEDQRKKKTPFHKGGFVPQMTDPGAFLIEKNQGFTGGAADGNEVRSPSSAHAMGGRSNSPRTERRIRCLRMKMLHQALGRYLVSTQFFGEAFSLAFGFGREQECHPGKVEKTPRPQCRPRRRFSLTRKRPDVIDSKWSGREDLNLRPPGPEPENSPFLKSGKIRNWKREAPNHSKRLETKSLLWGNTLSYCFGRNRRRSRLMLVLGV